MSENSPQKQMNVSQIMNLPPKTIKATDLYNSMIKAQRVCLEPWRFAQEHPEILETNLVSSYENEITSRAQTMMAVMLQDFYL